MDQMWCYWACISWGLQDTLLALHGRQVLFCTLLLFNAMALASGTYIQARAHTNSCHASRILS